MFHAEWHRAGRIGRIDSSTNLQRLDVIAAEPGFSEAQLPEKLRGSVTDFDRRMDEKVLDQPLMLLGSTAAVNEPCASQD
jgi:hypothetical protein